MINRAVIYTSKSCKECYALSLHYKELEAQFEELQFEYIDVTENRQIGLKQNIYTLPSLELYDNELLVAEFKHGNNKQYDHIVHFIMLHCALQEGRK